MENLGTVILATAALGTAAMGIVEALKWTALGEAGFGAILQLLGPLVSALQVAYGTAYELLLRAQYRGDQKDLARLLRQGVRVGVTEQNAKDVATFLGSIDAAQLQEAVRKAESGEELSAALRNVIGRFELAVDARIDAALALAQSRYAGTARVTASLVALIIAVVAGLALPGNRLLVAIVVGIAAVPIAPIAKDLVSALKAATSAIGSKS